MSKKLQVFISSTYTDLLEERQAAVAAVLKAGHIPAGMELFSAADRSQLDTIRGWIEQSDVYMLILGGRYGSIEPDSGLSYTELEFNYAVELGKPLYAVVISEDGLNKKVRNGGPNVIERDHGLLLREFRRKVLSNISSFFEEPKDIRLAVFESLPDLSRRKELTGWVRGDQIVDTQPLVDEIKKLSDENSTLRAKLAQAGKQIEKKTEANNEYRDTVRILESKKIIFKAGLSSNSEDIKTSALNLFNAFHSSFMTGIDNSVGMSKLDKFLFYTVGPSLAILNLVDYQKVAGVAFQRCLATNKGKQFLAQLNLMELDRKQLEQSTAATSTPADKASSIPEATEGKMASVTESTQKPKRAARKKTP